MATAERKKASMLIRVRPAVTQDGSNAPPSSMSAVLTLPTILHTTERRPKPQNPNIPLEDGRCVLLKLLLVEVIRKILSCIFPLLPNGRP